MRLRFLPLALLALAALLFAAGCDRVDSLPFTAEVDEPGYRRGKELIRQGRNRDALLEFQKVIEKRGLNNAPESHLEIGLLYQNHIKEPIPAIYHFSKYRELKPNTEQASYVRGRIDAAKREFASTLPGRPLDNPLTDANNAEVIERLQRENEQLHAANARLRVSLGLSARAPVDAAGNIAATPLAPEDTPAFEPSPVTASNTDEVIVSRPILDADTPAFEPITAPSFTPTRPSQTQQATIAATPSARPPQQTQTQNPPPATTSGRRHVVRQGEGLWTIARRYYGTPTAAQIDGIYNANRDRMTSKTDLKVGMELRIP